MSVAAARARCPSIETELLDADAESEDLRALTAQLLRVSPNIAALPPDAVVAEISRGPEGRAGQERALVERVRIRMNQLGHRAHVIVADDPITALTLARWRQCSDVIPRGQHGTPWHPYRWTHSSSPDMTTPCSTAWGFRPYASSPPCLPRPSAVGSAHASSPLMLGRAVTRAPPP